MFLHHDKHVASASALFAVAMGAMLFSGRGLWTYHREVSEGAFVAEKLSTIEGVMSTATHFVLKKYKDEGVIIDETADDDRLQVSP